MSTEQKKEERIRVIVKKPGDTPTVTVIPNSLDGMQAVVGGYIEEVILLDMRDIDCYANEEGKLLELAPNFALYDEDSKYEYDFVAGPAIFLKHDEEGEARSLTDEEIDQVARFFIEKARAFHIQESR